MRPPAAASPHEVFARLSAGISAGRWHELAALYAEDAVVEQPFALPSAAPRLEGRAAIDRHFRAAARGPLDLRARDVVVHETGDPEVIVAEFGYDGRVTTSGRAFRTANIQVLRVRDGLIAETRDYHDHPGLARAMRDG
ncbi:nuclear transport factor 2 family protein [Actinomadura mexicana]|uniref:Ketosteroid isomerase-related protein n=1 Tax=Actinomadura mexicana TaxID=134959 RepID=A0A239F7L9_9ACTN|nr:nuclear transport factor 2 family protein [Actinomadura mexicana]SNS52074.1 Ketosteroid isomerase-related protein [Actinomadura mexicana]